MFDLPAVQDALREAGLAGWLLYDFRDRNPLARRVLGIQDDPPGSRRWAYFVPREGEPRKLVHRIESGVLDALPGEKGVYLSWQEFAAGLHRLTRFARRDGGPVAMEYAPDAGNPYVGLVDAGTVEAVRDTGVAVVSSGDLVSRFEATLSDAQIASHLAAAEVTDAAFDLAWAMIADRTANDGRVEESAVRAAIMDHFAAHGLTTYHPPIVARNAHSGDPHYETGTGDDTAVRAGDFVLIDLWAKQDSPDGIYSDLTRTATVGRDPTAKETEVFHVVAAARDAAVARVDDSFSHGDPLRGREVDRVARDLIAVAGYGDYFVHRLGHSIGRETHGNGAHLDDLETRDERLLLPRTVFSVEPGVYLPEFGVRSEINVLVGADSSVTVTGGPLQRELGRIS